MTAQANPLYLAREVQHLARNAGAGDSLVFQKVAAISMCIVAVASGMHVLKELYRTLHPEERHSGRSR
jgi:quinolinate synthase